MKKNYCFGQPSSAWMRLALATLLTTGTAVATQAQGLGYYPSAAQNARTTYTDLGTTGTLISTANNDNALSSAQEIGFSFRYNKQDFTQFILSTNGYIKLGATAPSAATQYSPFTSNSAADVNIIAPSSNIDLYGAQDQAANPTSFRVATTGTPGSRVCTIQFKNLRDKATNSTPATPAQMNTMQFQIKLYEGTNTIEFVYGSWTPSANADASQPFIVGLRGSGPYVVDYLFAFKGSGADGWTETIFENPSPGLLPHFVRQTVLPDAGRTYRFRQAPSNDAAVDAVYTLGQLPIPFTTPHVVRAVVTNIGSADLTNVRATLSVTGANTFTNVKTIPSLPVGSSVVVPFDSFTPANTGNNVVSVSVPDDGDNANNNVSEAQSVNQTTFAYGAPSASADDAVGFNLQDGTATTGIFLAKFTTNAARNITAVNAGLQDPKSVGRTVYTVVCNGAGAIVSRSADYVIAAGDIGKTKTFTLPAPVAIASGDFYVGLAQAASPAGTPAFFPLAVEDEFPTRPGAFYAAELTGSDLDDIADAQLGRLLLEAVTSSTVTANSPELKRAVALYPNPSKGSVTLDIHGIAAKAPLQVQVINLLGQTVYTGSAKAEATNTLNVSTLAAGLYHLKVQNGDQYTIQKLVIE